MGRSKRLEIIFHNGEPEGIRIYMRHLSTIKAFVIPRIYLNEAKKLTGVEQVQWPRGADEAVRMRPKLKRSFGHHGRARRRSPASRLRVTLVQSCDLE